MAPKKAVHDDKELEAFQGVHAALKDLAPEVRRKVLASVSALLEIPGSAVPPTPIGSTQAASLHHAPAETRTTSSRPFSIRELMQDKNPGTNMERIALFAYYREKYEGTSRFSRGDLEKYFAKARENPPKNYDRDFNNTVLKGWIHEDGEESYITSKGLEAVESAFSEAGSKSNHPRKNRQRSSRTPSATK